MFKLKRLKRALRVWNKEVFGNIDENISRLSRDLAVTQGRISEVGYTDDLFEEEVRGQAELETSLSRQSELARQHSRISWLADGDRNTSFFHAMAKARRAKHVISCLTIDGVEVYDEEAIAVHMVQYYSNLFAVEEDVVDLGLVDTCLVPRVSIRQRQELDLVPSSDEIKAAVFAMSADSSPGPDGFGGIFYQVCWEVVGEDVIFGVQTFFAKNYLPTGLNSSTVVLLPKKESARVISDYRPIVLSNFLFKIISKVIATRLGWWRIRWFRR